MRLYFYFLIVMVATVVSSCIFCENIACDENPPYGHFILVSATTGQDLVFGPGRLYDKNQFKFYSVLATDTTFFEYRAIEIGGAGYDSVLRVLFSPLQEVAYMQLSNNDIDTLHISFRSSETRCCGTSTVIRSFRYNNSVEIPATTATQVLMK